MATLTTANIDTRIQTEGKDAVDRFGTQRSDFLRDTCIEISTTQEFEWLYEAFDLTVPATKTDWINLDTSFHTVETVVYTNSSGEKKEFKPLSEHDYVFNQYDVINSLEGYFRVRYLPDSHADNGSGDNLFQIAIINGPDTGATIQVLIKKYLTAPEDMPNFLEEAIVKGAVARFLEFQEGDDFQVALHYYNRYQTLLKQEFLQGNNKLRNATPRRAKTVKEIQNQVLRNRYTGN